MPIKIMNEQHAQSLADIQALEPQMINGNYLPWDYEGEGELHDFAHVGFFTMNGTDTFMKRDKGCRDYWIGAIAKKKVWTVGHFIRTKKEDQEKVAKNLINVINRMNALWQIRLSEAEKPDEMYKQVVFIPVIYPGTKEFGAFAVIPKQNAVSNIGVWAMLSAICRNLLHISCAWDMPNPGRFEACPVYLHNLDLLLRPQPISEWNFGGPYQMISAMRDVIQTVMEETSSSASVMFNDSTAHVTVSRLLYNEEKIKDDNSVVDFDTFIQHINARLPKRRLTYQNNIYNLLWQNQSILHSAALSPNFGRGWNCSTLGNAPWQSSKAFSYMQARRREVRAQLAAKLRTWKNA